VYLFALKKLSYVIKKINRWN